MHALEDSRQQCLFPGHWIMYRYRSLFLFSLSLPRWSTAKMIWRCYPSRSKTQYFLVRGRTRPIQLPRGSRSEERDACKQPRAKSVPYPRPSMCEVRSQSQMRNSGTSSNSQGRKARLSRFPRSQASVQWWFCLGLVHGYTCAVQHGDVLSFGSLPHLSSDFFFFSRASGRRHILLVREHRFHGCLARNSDRHPNGEDAPGTI